MGERKELYMENQIVLNFDDIESHALQSLSRQALREIQDVAENAVRRELEQRGLIKVVIVEGKQKKYIGIID
jgi:uncharacterized radical SAM superfamily Fe-S cluster-containing enzyme